MADYTQDLDADACVSDSLFVRDLFLTLSYVSGWFVSLIPGIFHPVILYRIVGSISEINTRLGKLLSISITSTSHNPIIREISNIITSSASVSSASFVKLLDRVISCIQINSVILSITKHLSLVMFVLHSSFITLDKIIGKIVLATSTVNIYFIRRMLLKFSIVISSSTVTIVRTITKILTFVQNNSLRFIRAINSTLLTPLYISAVNSEVIKGVLKTLDSVVISSSSSFIKYVIKIILATVNNTSSLIKSVIKEFFVISVIIARPFFLGFAYLFELLCESSATNYIYRGSTKILSAVNSATSVFEKFINIIFSVSINNTITLGIVRFIDFIVNSVTNSVFIRAIRFTLYIVVDYFVSLIKFIPLNIIYNSSVIVLDYIKFIYRGIFIPSNTDSNIIKQINKNLEYISFTFVDPFREIHNNAVLSLHRSLLFVQESSISMSKLISLTISTLSSVSKAIVSLFRAWG